MYTAAHGIQFGCTVLPVTCLGLSLHKQGIGITEQYDVVVLQLSVHIGIAVSLVLFHACASRLDVRTVGKVLFHGKRQISQRLPVVENHIFSVYVDRPGFKIITAAVVLVILPVVVGPHRGACGTGSVLTPAPQGGSVHVMQRTEEVVELCRIEVLVHGNGKDVLGGSLVVDREVESIV